MPRSLTTDAVIIRDGKVLLIRRLEHPFAGAWALPGGYVERDETAEHALVREAREETGLTVRPLKLIGFYDDPKRDTRGNVSLAYLCGVVDGEPCAGSDSANVSFFPADRLPDKLAFDHKRIIEDGVRLAGQPRGHPKGEGKKVLAGGVFNIIHPGHIHFLRQAKGLGDELVVVVASDATVKRNKKRLMFPAKERAGMVERIRCVDRAVIGDEHDMTLVVRRERPEVIALGHDQDGEGMRRLLRRAGIRCRVVTLGKLKGYSTKKITGG